ncbi:hypothetical protein ACIQZG_22220 [Lysinibacillus sp. NPDC096418]
MKRKSTWGGYMTFFSKLYPELVVQFAFFDDIKVIGHYTYKV